MSISNFTVTYMPVSALLGLVEAGSIAIPDIQRPFVWNSTQVRDLLDSLYRGFPIGFLISWQNPDVLLKTGQLSSGQTLLIDGQQRVSALRAAILGHKVLTKEYEEKPIRIAFNPKERKFEVQNSAILADPRWLPDIGEVFRRSSGSFGLVSDYCARNPEVSPHEVSQAVDQLLAINSVPVGMIQLSASLEIETVTEIFVRVNSSGVPLSQADFAMSKIAVNEAYGGPMLRRAIDYFCNLAAAPEFFRYVENDKKFRDSEYFAKVSWLRNETDDLYDPNYTDVLRVSFTSQFRRGRLQDLVALLSGRNFETRSYEEEIVADTFARLKEGFFRFANERNFKSFLLILNSAGFVDRSLIGSQSAVDFAYILYLLLREKGLPPALIESAVRKWYVMSVLTERYTNSPETAIDQDVRMIDTVGFERYSQDTYAGALSDTFWDIALPQALAVPATTSPFFRVFRAAQAKLEHKGFLSKDISVKDLIMIQSDLHHLFPKDVLKKAGMTRSQYNQVANLAICQSEINLAIGNKEPLVYLRDMRAQCTGGPRKYGNITSPEELSENLAQHCIPDDESLWSVDRYFEFLEARRRLMARVIRRYFERL